MHYSFPTINTIDDVLPYIEGRKDFVVADRGNYTVINYMVEMGDTFPPVVIQVEPQSILDTSFIIDEGAAIRRECRGLVFCNKTKRILRRPFHKFFNIGQREETLPANVDLSKPHVVLDKLDGSLIAPFRDHQGTIIWGTKMCAMDFHERVAAFVSTQPQYTMFVNQCLRYNLSPCFEYVGPENRIVLNYQEEDLFLTALRDINTGEYVSYKEMALEAERLNVPYVRAFDSWNNIDEFIEHARNLEDVEGFIVRFNDGTMVKAKCDWYVQIHRAKEKILFDRHIVEMILDETIDDVKSMLPFEDCEKLTKFERDFHYKLNAVVAGIFIELEALKLYNIDRKTFALTRATEMDSYTRAVIFRHWDNHEGIRQTVINTIRKNIGSNTNWAELREEWFYGVVLNS